jgi:hypothetical protein
MNVDLIEPLPRNTISSFDSDDQLPIRPNYVEEEDGIYSYIAAVSEEDKKRGKAAGDVLLFVFRGVSNGKYLISQVDDSGNTITDSECGKPCRVIKTYYGQTVVRREFTPESVIGSAFEDALNGRMKVKRAAAPPPPQPTATTVAPQTSDRPQLREYEYDNAVDWNKMIENIVTDDSP